MREDIPSSLRPPVSLALANSAESVPPAGALPGGCMYEPKWDGFRLAIVASGDGVSLWSRQGRDLSRYFPELLEAAAAQIAVQAASWTARR
ncbi:hypothetical protein [Arthrobacter sp. NQ7]|uniref:ATP-dependent DNA ligase n=1 Tax=Arthrobacter sp. NQ7 TaxID=3032303 RepID=UPI0032D9993C